MGLWGGGGIFGAKKSAFDTTVVLKSAFDLIAVVLIWTVRLEAVDSDTDAPGPSATESGGGEEQTSLIIGPHPPPRAQTGRFPELTPS